MGNGRVRPGLLRVNELRGLGDADPPSLRSAPWGAPDTFLGLPQDGSSFKTAEVVMLPVPYEATVSYIGGTRFGPRALLHASRYVELYDHELDTEPYRVGVHTLPELELPLSAPQDALAVLRGVMDALLEDGKFVILIGGEHSLSEAPILAHADRRDGRRVSVLQLDAHADLRAEYEGTPYSHACVMHRVYQRVPIVPVGVRSLTSGERALMRRAAIPTVFAHELNESGWLDRVVGALEPDVYVTIDVDFFDPAIMPATGTPEPGGASWPAATALLERVFRERRVVGCDIVELAPIPGLVAPDFLAAKLAYKLVGLRALCIEGNTTAGAE